MSSSVSIDIDALEGAISALTGLAGRIESQRNQVVSGTPCSLPSLSAGTIGAVSSWLTDQEPELSTRLDLARLLSTEGANVVTYTTDADTLANVQEMLGHEMAERVNDVNYDTDDEDLDELNEILGRRVTDPDVMSAMYEDLEPEGTARALTALEMQQSMYGDGSALDLAKTMREGLATASDDPSFSGESYANELMQLFIAPMHTDEQREWASDNELSSNAGASLMAFMMKDVNYSAEFLTGAANKLDEFEQLSAESDWMDASTWYYHTGISQFNESENAENADPMAEMMRALSRQPEVGYDFITAEGRADFYFDKRDWSHDGYDGIAALADRVSTDPDVYAAHPEGAALVAAQFVDLTSNSEGFNAEDAKAASDSVAHLLSTYMPSTAAAMDGGGGDLGNPQNHPGGLNVIGFGKMEHMPQFYREDLVNMTGVAMSTEDGMVDMAGGVANYRQTQVNALADQLVDDPDNIDLRTDLQGVMLDDAELRAFTTRIAGETEISEAHDTDQQRQFWSNLVAEGVKQVPIKPPIVGSIVEHGIDLGAGAVNDAWANSAEGVTDEWEDNATNGIAQMNYETYASLVESGVIPENEVPETLFDSNGDLKGWNDLGSPADRSSYAANASQGMSSYISDENLETTYRSRFETMFENPGGTDD
jgi:hypothetical protein